MKTICSAQYSNASWVMLSWRLNADGDSHSPWTTREHIALLHCLTVMLKSPDNARKASHFQLFIVFQTNFTFFLML